MRANFTYLILLIVLPAFSSTYSQNDENSGKGVEITSTFLSRYMWRGYDLSHKDPSLLSYINYSPKALDGFTISAGTIFGLKNAPEQGDKRYHFDEFDLSLAYERPVIPDKFVITVSALYYKYTSHWTKTYYEDTKDIELNLWAVYTASRYFIPYVSYFRGVDKKIEGNYFETGFSNEFSFTDNLALAPKWYAGYSSQYEFRSDPAFSNLAAEFPLSYSRGSFYCELSGIFIKPLRTSLNGSKKTVFCSSLNIAYAL